MQTRSAIFRALGDPSRLAIFECLARKEAPVKDLTARFRITQPAVSQHLAALRKAEGLSPSAGTGGWPTTP
jgi:DNA-binding transcriptional ArsR family regulator